MAILSTTLCYPNSANPMRGIFVQRRLQEIAKLMPLRVVAPVPWFPVVVPMACSLGLDGGQSPPVWHQRMYYLPGILKRYDACFYARALEKGIKGMHAGVVPRGAGTTQLGKGDGIDLIDAHFEWPDAVGAYLVARRLGIPLVCTLRGKLVSQIEHRVKLKLIKEMLLNADALIAVSKSLADLANEVAGKEMNIRVVPNGIDGDIFQYCNDRNAARAELDWSPADRYVISVGHLQELKGFHHLIEIWPVVRKRIPDAQLVLVGGSAGEGGYENRLRAMIEQAGLTDCITLAGRQTPQRIATMLNAADLFTLASRSEGWSNALAEALACGCPAVATDVGGNQEVMNHWGLGHLAAYGKWDAFGERLCACLEQTWNRSQIAEFGGRRSWGQVAAECVEVFKGVIRG